MTTPHREIQVHIPFSRTTEAPPATTPAAPAAGVRPAQPRQAQARSERPRQAEARSAEARQAWPRPAEARPAEARPAEARPAEARSARAADPASPNWPSEQAPPARADWRDRLTLATDLALIGIAVTILALPVITAPAALATGSAAVRARYADGRLPPWRSLAGVYRRGILPGLPVLLAVAALILDLAAIRGGWVPGGPPLLALTALATIGLSGWAALALATLGRAPGLTWRDAARQAWGHPACVAALALVNVIAFVLALAVPVTVPLVIGFHLFAIHMLTDRLCR